MPTIPSLCLILQQGNKSPYPYMHSIHFRHSMLELTRLVCVGPFGAWPVHQLGGLSPCFSSPSAPVRSLAESPRFLFDFFFLNWLPAFPFSFSCPPLTAEYSLMRDSPNRAHPGLKQFDCYCAPFSAQLYHQLVAVVWELFFHP